MEQNIHKRRLDLNGNPIEEPKKQEVATSTTVRLLNLTLLTAAARVVLVKPA